MKELTINLTDLEWKAIQKLARREIRTPKQQAEYLIMDSLIRNYAHSGLDDIRNYEIRLNMAEWE